LAPVFLSPAPEAAWWALPGASAPQAPALPQGERAVWDAAGRPVVPDVAQVLRPVAPGVAQVLRPVAPGVVQVLRRAEAVARGAGRRAAVAAWVAARRAAVAALVWEGLLREVPGAPAAALPLAVASGVV
jgi:hypothetical protein